MARKTKKKTARKSRAKKPKAATSKPRAATSKPKHGPFCEPDMKAAALGLVAEGAAEFAKVVHETKSPLAFAAGLVALERLKEWAAAMHTKAAVERAANIGRCEYESSHR